MKKFTIFWLFICFILGISAYLYTKKDREIKEQNKEVIAGSVLVVSCSEYRGLGRPYMCSNKDGTVVVAIPACSNKKTESEVVDCVSDALLPLHKYDEFYNTTCLECTISHGDCYPVICLPDELKPGIYGEWTDRKTGKVIDSKRLLDKDTPTVHKPRKKKKSTYRACEDCDDYLFWDKGHYTSEAPKDEPHPIFVVPIPSYDTEMLKDATARFLKAREKGDETPELREEYLYELSLYDGTITDVIETHRPRMAPAPTPVNCTDGYEGQVYSKYTFMGGPTSDETIVYTFHKSLCPLTGKIDKPLSLHMKEKSSYQDFTPILKKDK